MMNRRGQADQVISSVIVFFVVALLGILFVNLSAGAGTVANLFNIGRATDTDFVASSDSFLSKQIEIKIGDTSQKVFVLEAIGFVHAGSLPYKSLADAFAKIAGDQDSCLFVISGLDSKGTGGYSFLYYKKNDISFATTKNSILAKHESLFDSISYTDNSIGKTIYVKYYYGKCLEAGK